MNPGQDPSKKTYFGFEIEDVTKALLELEDLQASIGQGLFDKLIPIPPGGHEQLKNALGDKYDPKAAEERIRHILKGALTQGLLLKDAIGLSAQSMEAFYYLAYCLFQNDRLSESFHLFKALCALDPLQWKYFYALASVLHKQKAYHSATAQYVLATSLHPQEKFPMGHFHSADCFAGLNDLTSAIVSLSLAVDACDESIEEHRVVRQRAKDLMDVFANQLRQQPFADTDSEDKPKTAPA